MRSALSVGRVGIVEVEIDEIGSATRDPGLPGPQLLDDLLGGGAAFLSEIVQA